jgi:hypothetical protein
MEFVAEGMFIKDIRKKKKKSQKFFWIFLKKMCKIEKFRMSFLL